MIQNFQKGLDSYLTKEQVKEVCPLAFAEAPTNPDVSGKYLFVNTETIIDDLDKLGWKPVTAAQRKQRGDSTIFSKIWYRFKILISKLLVQMVIMPFHVLL